MKPILLIISDTIRTDLHRPLALFKHFKVVHAYRQASYGDMTRADWAAVPAVQFRSPFKLLKLLSSLKPAVVQLPEPTAGRRAALTTGLLLPPAKRLGAKVVVPFFENVPLEQKFKPLTLKLIKLVMRRVINQADLLIYLNQGAKHNLLSLGAPNHKLVKLFWGSWGVSADFKPRSNVKGQLSNVVLYVGVVSRRKGIGYLVEAMERVRQRVPNAKLWLVGPKGDFTPPQRDWIKLFGPVKHSKLPAFFQKATVFCLSSVNTNDWQEQVGMVNLQALSCGTPVVTTRSGAIPEFVRAGEGVAIVPQRSSSALAGAIIKLLNLEPFKRRAFGAAGRYWVLKHYQSKKNVAVAEKTLLSLLQT